MARKPRWQLNPHATPEQLAELAARDPKQLRSLLHQAQLAAMPSSNQRQAAVAQAKDAAGRRV
jgi:hypothetical protein